MTGRYRCFLNKETEKGRTRLLVMISGRGSNMRAITSHLERGKIAAQLVARRAGACDVKPFSDTRLGHWRNRTA